MDIQDQGFLDIQDSVGFLDSVDQAFRDIQDSVVQSVRLAFQDILVTQVFQVTPVTLV